MNFDIIKDFNDFKQLYDFCHEAELLAISFPSLSATSSRKALETIVKYFYVAKYGAYPEDSSLYELIENGCFSSYLDDSLLSCVHLVRKIGNNGAHGESVSKKESVICIRALYDVVTELLSFLGLDFEKKEFDENIYKEINITEEPHIPNEVVISNYAEIKKYKNNIDESIVLRSNVDFTEAETRKIYIDQALKEAGWDVCEQKGAIVAGKACIEIKLDGMPNSEGVGYADYILFDDNNIPLAVIEAKRTSFDAYKGSQQAKLYAECIYNKWHVKPIIFYTNGYTTYVIDNAGFPDRKIYGYYSKDELHSILVRNIKLINDTRINPLISDRYFIQNACTAVCESINKKHRKNLIVMATGTGKTRCAISIIDVLQKFNYAKRVLFLADRTALINQAKAAFTKFLPDTPPCVLSSTKESDRDYEARLTLSTYQTMINLIDCDKKKYGIAHFDLIVVDECHRSIYNKYRAIFNYFDSLILGLTATPREQIDSSTYEVFELPKGEPTFAYDYETAVKERFLVNFHAFERTTKILKDGLNYDDLSPEEKEQYETLFSDGNIDNMPKKIDAKEFEKRIINSGTIDQVINTILTEGMRVNGGEVLGKTIIFAQSHFHAEKIVERFTTLYPDLQSKGYCRLIDNYVSYAQTLIDEFSIKDNDFRIAVSVDMLDTGIDVPEVCNLVFFKKVFSKIKFWQMIGRGTRTCKDLNVFSPSRNYFENGVDEDIISYNDKQGFYIFDFCNVFEFFRIHPDGREAKNSLNLSQRIFELKLDMVCELQKLEHQENEEHKSYYLKYRLELFNKIVKLNRNLINVKTSLKYVNKYSVDDNWNYLSVIESKEIKKQITPLIDPDSDDEKAKRFDIWLLNMELEEIIGENDYSRAIQKVTTICSLLLDMTTIPEINQKKELLIEFTTNQYWENINVTKLERIRCEVRDLIKYLPVDKIYIIESNFEDDVVKKQGGSTPSPQFKNYKQRVIDYLESHYESGAIYKIRNLIQLTNDDIEELKQILWKDLGTVEEYNSISNGLDLGAFVRSIVGFDKEAISKIFSDYLSKYSFNSRQQEFLHQIITFVMENGDIEPNDLYDSEPFKHQEYTDIFVDTAPLYQFVNLLHTSIMAGA